jgi:hypothetical protein
MQSNQPEPETKLVNTQSLQSKAEAENNLEKWKNVKINLGVFGAKSELKTLFINKIIGVSSSLDQPQQQQQILFPHSNNVNIVVWDLGPLYLDSMDVSQYDLMIFFREDNKKISEDDTKFIENVEAKGKKCLFVNFDSHQNFDISKLHLDIMQILVLVATERLESYTLSIDSTSKEIIEAKKSVLHSRIEFVAHLSTMFGHLLQLPALSITCDALKLSAEIWFYREQLGLSPRHLAELSSEFNCTLTEIISNCKYASILFAENLNTYAETVINAMPAIMQLQPNDIMGIIHVVPKVGSLLHCTVSYVKQKFVLEEILEEFTKIAKDVRSFVAKKKLKTDESATVTNEQ